MILPFSIRVTDSVSDSMISAASAMVTFLMPAESVIFETEVDGSIFYNVTIFLTHTFNKLAFRLH